MSIVMRFVLAAFLIVAIASLGAPARALAAADAGSELIIAESLPKMVKLYGAGGFRGLEAYGTGFLVSADGVVVTSWGPLLDTETVTAVLDDGRRFQAKLAGVDPSLRLAVLKLDGEDLNLPFFDLSASADASPGDRVLAFSNMFRVAAGDEPVSVMHGMVLAKAPLAARRGRFESTIEVPVYYLDSVTNNPGAAGGVIVTLDGHIAGMIGHELRGEASETWINYALPARAISERIAAILGRDEASADLQPRRSGRDEVRRPVDLGLVMIPDVTVRTPSYVSDVIADSPAATAGLRRDDLILFANGEPVRSIRELTASLSRAERGDELVLVVRRDGRLETLRLLIP